jgi:selenide,water dikinase
MANSRPRIPPVRVRRRRQDALDRERIPAVTAPRATRHLLLVGGGHAHVFVLKSLAMRPEPRLRLTMISPSSYATYSGMVPGVLAGQYTLREAQIDVRALAARAQAAFLADRVVRIDAARRIVDLAERAPLAYDLLSLDIGSQPAHAERVAGDAPATMVKPIEVAADGIDMAFAAPAPPDGRRVVVVGAGPGGVEVAFALATRLRREGNGTVTLCDAAPQPVTHRHPRTSGRVAAVLARHGIQFIGGVMVVAVDAAGVRLADDRILPATFVVWATGAAGPSLLSGSGLPVDTRGFLQVDDALRCVTHPEIFAAGDCATLTSYPDLEKAGVYAVRQGPVLARNLRAAARGAALRVFKPQRGYLSLLNTGDGKAILSWGRLALHGRAAWRLKDHIDRAFIRRYARPDLSGTGMSGDMVPCGGCAAKLGADVLGRVLSRLALPHVEGVVVGLDAPDDAAVFAHPPGTLAVATVDAFPPFADDLYIVGRVAATNAASDLYAMGAEGAAALALVCLPEGEVRYQESSLEHFLRGALAQLDALSIPMVGGHTIVGEQLLLGFAMHGWVHPQRLLRKRGARPGDALLLTKPLGTGVVLAAGRAGVAPAEWVEAALASMLRSNGPAMRLLQMYGTHACTDVTGFGLAGHLNEMLRASGVGARLRGADIPALPGARRLLDAGWRSSFHERNLRAQAPAAAPLGAAPHFGETAPVLALCYDPQTSGGLLAAVPAERLAALRQAFDAAGEALYLIGELTAGAPHWELA